MDDVSESANRSTHVPVSLTSFIGRARELGDLEHLARTCRLLTLTGAGGCGKTRLALELVKRLAPSCPDGVFVVSLAPIPHADLVMSAMAEALGLTEVPGEPIFDTLARSIGERRLLLLLDKFEHLLPSGTLVASLLAACPRLLVVATSRELLRLHGEQVYPVPPLTIPPSLETPPDDQDAVALVAHSEAGALFVDRARRVQPGFRLHAENAPSVAEICARLDGLPLALELAAARIRLFSPRIIAGRLVRRLPLLTGGPRDLPARQQTLRGAIAWSHDLLSADERLVFRRIAIFVGGCTLAAAVGVCGNEPLDAIASLIDKSLMFQSELPDGTQRFGMLETIREFGLEQLEASGELAMVQRRHAEVMVSLAEVAKLNPRGGAEQVARLARIDAEQDNLRAALTWAESHEDAGDLGLRLVTTLARYWEVRGHLGEARASLERALSVDRQPPRALLMRACSALARVVSLQADDDRAIALHEQVLAYAREVNDTAGIAQALGELGSTARRQGDAGRTATYFQEALGLFRAVDDRSGVAWSLGNLGQVHLMSGNLAAAATCYDECLTLYRLLGDDDHGAAWALAGLGRVRLAEGDLASAAALCEESLTLFQTATYKGAIGIPIGVLTEVAWRSGDLTQAHALAEQTLRHAWETGARRQLAAGLEGLAVVAALLNHTQRAARLFGAVDALRATVGPGLPSWGSEVERVRGVARAALGERSFAAAWAAGRSMTLEDARELALNGASAPATKAVSTVAGPLQHRSEIDQLTGREREVAVLVSQGRSNRQIAVQLVISERTVHGHVANILSKLGFAGRAQIAVWAVRQGLAAPVDS